jgi:hypothetical protein
VFWVCGEGQVDRAGSTMSHEGKSCRGGATWVFPTREVPVAGTCDRERSRGGVSSWDEAPGWEVLRWHGVPSVPLSGK